MPEPASQIEQPGPATRASGSVQAELASARAQLSGAERETERLRQALADAEARERALIHELQHRVRNMLGVIQSVFRRTRESEASQDEFAEHFQGRLDTISRFQGDLVQLRFGGVDLEDMIRDELLRVHVAEGRDLTIEGPPVRLGQKALELMGLAIHELTTNSIKFGALYHHATLAIRWTLSGAPTRPVLDFRWTESSVPLIAAAPRPRGFGRKLVEEALPYQLGAATTFELKPGGLDCSILLPLPPADAAQLDGAGTDEEPPFLPFETEEQ